MPLRSSRGAVAVGAIGALVVGACTAEEQTTALTGDSPGGSGPTGTVIQPTVADSPAGEPAPSTAPTSSTPTPATTQQPAPTTEPPVDARCGDDASFGDGVELTLWHSLGGDAAIWIGEVIAEFEREHPAISVEYEVPESGWPAGITQLGALPVGDRPDVVLASEMTARLQADSGAFVPVEECTGFDTPAQFTDLHAVIDATYRIDDVLWAAPYNASTPVLMYDGNLWRRAGLDPDDPPATIDELEVAIRRLRDSGEAATGITLYDRAAMWLVTVPASQAGDVLVDPANGRAGLDIDGVDLATPLAVSTLETFRQLRQEGYVNWVGLNQNAQDDLVTLVSPTDLSGMTLHTSASLGDIYRLQDAAGLKDVEIRAAPFPGPGTGAPVGGGAWWLLDRGEPAHIEASWVFVDWITQPERVAELAAYTGYVPTTRRAADDPVVVESWAERPAYRAGYEQTTSASPSPAGASLQVGPQVDVWRALEIAAASAIDTGLDPAETLAAAEDVIRTYLDAYAEVYAGG